MVHCTDDGIQGFRTAIVNDQDLESIGRVFQPGERIEAFGKRRRSVVRGQDDRTEGLAGLYLRIVLSTLICPTHTSEL